MQPADRSIQTPKNNTVIRNYNHQTFRPEAVEAHTTRQAGEPWNANYRFEGLMIVGLTIVAAVGLTFVIAGGH
jgi:hypothetical protein